MSNNGRAAVKPRVGASRMKVLVDEQTVAARRDAVVKDAKAATRERSALNELSNPNRVKPNGVGKENKGLEKLNAVSAIPIAASTVVAGPTTRTRSGSIAAQQSQSHRVIVSRPLSTSATTALKQPSTRHTQRESSIAAAAVYRPAVGSRHRDDEENDTASRKRIRVPSGAARPAPQFPSSRSGSSGTTQDAEDHMEISEAEGDVPSDFDDEAAQPVERDQPEEEQETVTFHRPSSASPEPEPIQEDWTVASPDTEARYDAEIQTIKENFKDEVDEWDVTMVSEYSEEIFEYMGKLEVQYMADPDYMDNQGEIEWHQRATLVDWLVQIHARYHLLPESLWIAINIIDRFLSKRVVSLVKLQLVGITAMFIAVKYEEIMAPSVDEFVFMTEGGYTKDEILKGERIILQSLGFHISQYCSPYSWVRRISKADDYDIQTRTLSKFLMEVCLLDYRFLRAKPSMIAAVGMYTARRMLEGDWNDAFVFYSNYTGPQLEPGYEFILETIAAPSFSQTHTYRKYSHKRFLKASMFAREWAKDHWVPEQPQEEHQTVQLTKDAGHGEDMCLDDKQ